MPAKPIIAARHPAACRVLPELGDSTSDEDALNSLITAIWANPWHRGSDHAGGALEMILASHDLVLNAERSAVLPAVREAFFRARGALMDAERAITEASVVWLEHNNPEVEVQAVLVGIARQIVSHVDARAGNKTKGKKQVTA